MNKHKIVVFGPSLEAVSGVSTHVRMLLASDLARDFELLHFQVGSEGRRENAPEIDAVHPQSAPACAVPVANWRRGDSSQHFAGCQGLLAGPRLFDRRQLAGAARGEPDPWRGDAAGFLSRQGFSDLGPAPLYGFVRCDNRTFQCGAVGLSGV